MIDMWYVVGYIVKPDCICDNQDKDKYGIHTLYNTVYVTSRKTSMS